MDLLTTPTDLQTLFLALYRCPDEQAVEALLAQHPALFVQANWKPLGGQ